MCGFKSLLGYFPRKPGELAGFSHFPTPRTAVALVGPRHLSINGGGVTFDVADAGGAGLLVGTPITGSADLVKTGWEP